MVVVLVTDIGNIMRPNLGPMRRDVPGDYYRLRQFGGRVPSWVVDRLMGEEGTPRTPGPWAWVWGRSAPGWRVGRAGTDRAARHARGPQDPAPAARGTARPGQGGCPGREARGARREAHGARREARGARREARGARREARRGEAIGRRKREAGRATNAAS